MLNDREIRHSVILLPAEYALLDGRISNSPDVATRLRALETWAQNAPAGSIDPLNPAYGNDDARALAGAMELITQDWAHAAEAGQ